MPFFVKFGSLKPDLTPDDLKRVDPAFSAWIKDLKARGFLILTGSFETRENGMTVLHANDREEAMRILESDPFNELLSSWRVHEWKAADLETPAKSR